MGLAVTKNRKIQPYRFIGILDRMIVWDLTKTVTTTLTVLVIIIVSRKFIDLLDLALDGIISADTALDILGLKMIVASVNFLPAAMFMAILMVLGRMYKDQEIAAIACAGRGVGKIYYSVFLFALPLSIISTVLSLYAAPWAEKQMLLLTFKDLETADLRGIAPGRFSEYRHGDVVFYTEEIDQQQRMRHIFIQHRQEDKVGIITAEYGMLKDLPEGQYIVLEQGHRTEGVPGQADFNIEKFAEYAVRIDKKVNAVSYSRESLPSSALLISDDVSEQAELQKRFSTPLGIVFLSLLAVPLAKLSPRSGIYGSVLFAFLIYFIYGNIIRMNYSWVINKAISLWFGYVWVYALLALLSAILLTRLYTLRWLLLKIRLGNRI